MALSKIEPDSLNIGQVGGRRNLIINGAMQVAQYSTSETGVGGGYNTVDRFRVSQNSGGFGGASGHDEEQSSDAPDGFGFSWKLVKNGSHSTQSDDAGFFEQRIEGQNLQSLKYGVASAQTTTLSFWVKSSISGTYGVALHLVESSERSQVQTYTISSADTWEHKTVTFVGDTSVAITNDNARRMDVRWVLGAGADLQTATTGSWQDGEKMTTSSQVDWVATDDAEFYITGVQLEVGDTVTPFEHRSYGEELALCQRYYYTKTAKNGGRIGVGNAYTSTIMWIYGGDMPVTMRASPTISLPELGDVLKEGVAWYPVTSINNATVSSSNSLSYSVNVASSALSQNQVTFHGRSSQTVKLAANAEL